MTKKLLIFLFGLCLTLSGMAALLAISGCASNDNSGDKLPEQFPKWLEEVTYNDNIYKVNKIITFRKCPEITIHSNPPGVTEEERQEMKEKVSIEFLYASSNVHHETYGFDIDSVCNKIGAENAASSDFGGLIGKASTASHTYDAYSLKGIDVNEAIAIRITLRTDLSKVKDEDYCCAECYIKCSGQQLLDNQ
jgi:predicted HAD superfamily Cof-like phosphohydrolase